MHKLLIGIISFKKINSWDSNPYNMEAIELRQAIGTTYHH